MHRTANRHMQQRVRCRARQADTGAICKTLSTPEAEAQIAALLPAHRNRVFKPLDTASMFVGQALSEDHSCQRAVNEAAIRRIAAGLEPCSTHTGGFCKARERLPTAVLVTLARYVARQLAAGAAPSWEWRGRAVRIVDGTTLQMRDTPENQQAYPQPRNQQPGLGFPICRLVALLCLGSGSVLDAAIGACRGKGGDEQSLLRSILDSLHSGDVLLGDALYPTYFLLCWLVERGIDGVFEQHGARQRTTDFRTGRHLGARDHVMTWPKPRVKPDWMSTAEYEAAPQTLQVRELRAGGKTLVTTLLCPKQAPKAEVAALFAQRWNVELDLRNIKTTLGMEMLSCHTPQMVIKEIWVYLLGYNLVRLMMVQAAGWADLLPRQISFKHSLQVCTAWIHHTSVANPIAREQLFVLLVQQRVGDRPGRVEPRAVKRRPKNHRLLTTPRDQARAQIRKCGHPSKLK